MYKVGDRVRVKDDLSKEAYYGGFYFSPYMETYTGRSFTVDSVRKEDDDKCYTLDGTGSWRWSDEMLIEIEKVEESKEMTFPEMAQKLIDGEFEVGTKLVTTDADNDKNTFYVSKNMYGYGISKEAAGFIPNKATFPSVLNAKWTVKEEVKEQPIKEMSIEELQKELGYKIKIVERESK